MKNEKLKIVAEPSGVPYQNTLAPINPFRFGKNRRKNG